MLVRLNVVDRNGNKISTKLKKAQRYEMLQKKNWRPIIMVSVEGIVPAEPVISMLRPMTLKN